VVVSGVVLSSVILVIKIKFHFDKFVFFSYLLHRFFWFRHWALELVLFLVEIVYLFDRHRLWLCPIWQYPKHFVFYQLNKLISTSNNNEKKKNQVPDSFVKTCVALESNPAAVCFPFVAPLSLALAALVVTAAEVV